MRDIILQNPNYLILLLGLCIVSFVISFFYKIYTDSVKRIEELDEESRKFHEDWDRRMDLITQKEYQYEEMMDKINDRKGKRKWHRKPIKRYKLV